MGLKTTKKIESIDKRSASKKAPQAKVKLSVRGLCKSFGAKVVLDHLDLDVFENESLVILGGSGTGKSVLIKTIVGLLKPDSGSITLEGQDITNISTKERNALMGRFAFLFQGNALFDSMTIWENVAFFLTHTRGMPRKEAQEVAVRKLRDVGLEETVMHLYPSEISGGMQKRVAFARAIVNDPEVLFFDEPTSGLDPIMSSVVSDLIIKGPAHFGSTAITITHDINSARKIASRVAMLYQGKIVWIGDVDNIDKSGNAILDQFIAGKTTGPIKLAL